MVIAIGVLFILICVLLIGVILLQKGRGSGLSGAFGGVGGHSAFGSRTGDMFTWVTVVLVALFLVTGAGAVLVFRPDYVSDEGTQSLVPHLPTQPLEEGEVQDNTPDTSGAIDQAQPEAGAEEALTGEPAPEVQAPPAE